MDLVAEAIRLAESARKHELAIRVMGACAVKIHCQKYRELHDGSLDRVVTDMDFMSRRRDREHLKQFFLSEGYKPATRLMAMTEEVRHLYDNPQTGIHVDVFFDELSMCHRIDFRDRLEVDFPTIAVADLLLEKLQIVEMNEKDVKDVVVLFLEHDVGENDSDSINATYIAKLLSKDWGFYHTATTNLSRIDGMLSPRFQSFIQEAGTETASRRINALLTRVESEPKSISWRTRAKIGTKRKWYTDVEEIVRDDVAEAAGLNRRET